MLGGRCDRHRHPSALDPAAQILAVLARARQSRELAELVGAGALSATDRGYLGLERAFERTLASQRPSESRSLADTFQRAWVLSVLPRRELTMLSAEALDTHYQQAGP